MLHPDRGEAPIEGARASILRGQRLKVGEQADGAVVAGGVAACDLDFDLTPSAGGAALPEDNQTLPLRLLRLFGLALPLCFPALGLGLRSRAAAISCARICNAPAVRRGADGAGRLRNLFLSSAATTWPSPSTRRSSNSVAFALGDRRQRVPQAVPGHRRVG